MRVAARSLTVVGAHNSCLMVSADRLGPFYGRTNSQCLLSERRLQQLPHRHHIIPQTMKNPNSVALCVKDCPPTGLPCDYAAYTRSVPDLLWIPPSGSLCVGNAVRVLRTLVLSMLDGHSCPAVFIFRLFFADTVHGTQASLARPHQGTLGLHTVHNCSDLGTGTC